MRKLKRLKCPVVFCEFEAKSQSQIGLMTQSYDHVVRFHTLVDIKDEHVKTKCFAVGCDYIANSYTRQMSLERLMIHINNKHQGKAEPKPKPDTRPKMYVKPTDGSKVEDVKPTDGSKVEDVKPTDGSKVEDVKGTHME